MVFGLLEVPGPHMIGNRKCLSLITLNQFFHSSHIVILRKANEIIIL